MSDLPLHRTMQDDEIDRLKAENEVLRERIENYEALKRMHRLENYPNELAARGWLLRKQAEAVEAATTSCERGSAKESGWCYAEALRKYAQRLRQQADEAERAGGEK